MTARETKEGSTYDTNVFINCPFDSRFRPLFDAIVFAIHDAGFRSRSSLERSSATEVRISKILRIIGECRYGVHDISRTQLGSKTKLPRFNMPLELGLFLGSHHFGDHIQNQKCCLILDSKPNRWNVFISDIGGQDVFCHEGSSTGAIREVRNWLRTETKRDTIPGHEIMCERFELFQNELPRICKLVQLNPKTLIYDDYVWVVNEWLKENT